MKRLHFVGLSLASKKGLVAVCIATLTVCLILSLVFCGLMQGINELSSSIADRNGQEVRLLQIKPYTIIDNSKASKVYRPYTDDITDALRSDSRVERFSVGYYTASYNIDKIMFNERELLSAVFDVIKETIRDGLSGGVPQELGSLPTRNYRIYGVDPAFDTFVAFENRLENAYILPKQSELILAGRDFLAGDVNSMLVSKQQAYFLGYEDYKEIVGQTMSFSYTDKNGNEATRDVTIIGVYSDMLAVDYRGWVAVPPPVSLEEEFPQYVGIFAEDLFDLLLPDNFIVSMDFFDDVPDSVLYQNTVTGLVPREEAININVLVKKVLDVPRTAEKYVALSGNYVDYVYSYDYLIQVIDSVQFIGLCVLAIAIMLSVCVVIYIINLTILDMRRRKKAIALLKVIGYRQSDILFMNIFEFSFISAIASAVSVWVSYRLIRFVNDYCVTLFSEFCEISANAFVFDPMYAVIAVVFTFVALITATVLATAKFSKMESITILKD